MPYYFWSRLRHPRLRLSTYLTYETPFGLAPKPAPRPRPLEKKKTINTKPHPPTMFFRYPSTQPIKKRSTSTSRKRITLILLSPHKKVRRNWSLKALTEHLLRCTCAKEDATRKGAWERRPLPQHMRTYAATDAFLSLQLQLILESMPVSRGVWGG